MKRVRQSKFAKIIEKMDPKLAALAISLVMTFLIFFKLYCVPALVRWVIEIVPLNKDPTFHSVLGFKINENGLQFGLNLSINDARVLVPKITIRIPNIRVFDLDNSILLATINIKDDIKPTFNKDFTINNHFDIEIGELKYLKRIITRLIVGGHQELQRYNFRLKFNLSFSIFGIWFSVMNCAKSINIKDLQQQKFEFRGKVVEKFGALFMPLDGRLSMLTGMFLDAGVVPTTKLVEIDPISTKLSEFEIPRVKITTPNFVNDMLPDMIIQTRLVPFFKSLQIEIAIEFKQKPMLELSMPRIEFKTSMNDSLVAQITINPFEINTDLKVLDLVIIVEPTVVNNLAGPIITAQGLVKGAVRGILNGIVYGDWGKDLSILSVNDVRMGYPNEIEWIHELLLGVEIDHDLNAGKVVGMGRSGIDEYVGMVVEGVVQHYECSIQ